MVPVQFQPLASQPTPSFWTALNSYKLDKARLDDSEQWISGWLEQGKSITTRSNTLASGESLVVGIDGAFSVGGNAFGDTSENRPPNALHVSGILKNYNTIEEFREGEGKKRLFDDLAHKILETFGTDEPLLNPFLMVTFADLKNYRYHYWFAFPAFVADPAWTFRGDGLADLAETEVTELRELETELKRLEGRDRDCFLVKGSPGHRSIAPLAAFNRLHGDVPSPEVIVAFHDPSASAVNPGWPLRNILYYLHSVHRVTEIYVICLREGATSRSGRLLLSPSRTSNSPIRPVAVGWERNGEGKLASKVAELGPMMDPAQLARQAVDLNLKLMKWRISPTLDLDRIAGTRCLLLGAGTLGCYVARNLMAWGIRNITFVDSSTVSFSNPVRQPLFRFEDCLDGGQPKAACAAARLREISPGVNANGRQFTIPMPGHPVTPLGLSNTRRDIEQLKEVIAGHDAVFLLMDSRESRWLPTLLGKEQGKIVINAALGFDTFLVMRHGAGRAQDQDLGCYFCNDVVAPTDVNRTLDQMCTVTRPGVAPLAAACASEMLVTLLQHPLRVHAPAFVPTPHHEDTQHLPFGGVPHQIRGFLGQWRNLLIKGTAYNQCTACSPPVLAAYRQGGMEWLLQVFSNADVLEHVTGLDQLHAASESLVDDIDWVSDSEEEP
ncbi:E1-like protein-activating enzyme Gsa7p/Apg7p [Kwoniella dejecticola CBS 10117]|uniref:Ubiquitin-like modifier-activating enzyme ATG7 n=1 Tax=Kwoniella dejecticola CBS 10117 TaxID=1296121 RepID=A0AAJ8KJC9_9TREE